MPSPTVGAHTVPSPQPGNPRAPGRPSRPRKWRQSLPSLAPDMKETKWSCLLRPSLPPGQPGGREQPPGSYRPPQTRPSPSLYIRPGGWGETLCLTKWPRDLKWRPRLNTPALPGLPALGDPPPRTLSPPGGPLPLPHQVPSTPGQAETPQSTADPQPLSKHQGKGIVGAAQRADPGHQGPGSAQDIQHPTLTGCRTAPGPSVRTLLHKDPVLSPPAPAGLLHPQTSARARPDSKGSVVGVQQPRLT